MKLFLAILGAIIMAPLLSPCQNIRVLDSLTQKPVSNATVAILDGSSGKITHRGITNADGDFSFEVAANSNLHISVTAIGYKKMVVKQSVEVQTILLATTTKQLKEVKITANTSPISINGNTMEYDISKVPNAEYLNLTDIISYLPFLQVTEKGEIKLMEEPLIILIDNKPSIIYKDGPSLKSLPPQAVDKIEVVFVPTARSGGKTINITLKRDYFLGWNGSVETSGSRLGVSPRAAVSYWRKKYGFDASVNYGYNNAYRTNNTAINYLQQQSTLNSMAESRINSSSGGFSFSSYYTVNDANAFDLQFNVSPSKNNTITNSTITTQTLAAAPQVALSDITNNTSRFSYSGSLNYTHKFKKAGNVFYLLSRFFKSASDRDQLIFNSGNTALQNNAFKGKGDNSESSIEAVLQRNSNKAFRYTIGSKIIFRNNASDNRSVSNSIAVVTPFEMQQLVSSTYADADWAIKKFTLHTGVSFEYNKNTLRLPNTSQREFFNLTPNISLSYTINPVNSLSFTYTRNLTRPGDYVLSPVLTPQNAYQRTVGNENVNNQIRNNYGMQYYGNFKAVRLGFNLSYTRINGFLGTESTVGTNNVVISQAVNIDKNESFTAGFSADFTLLKILRFSHFSNGTYILQNSGIYSTRMWSGYISDRVSYQLNKKNSFSLSMLAYSPNVNLQGVEQEIAYLNWGLSYGHYFDIMKKHPASIGISISNPVNYNGLPSYSTINAPAFTQRTDTKRSNAVVGVSFRVQIKGKQVGNRTFNKARSIQNNDLSVP